MNNISNRLKTLLAGSGPILFAIRLPFRILKTAADLITTRFYSLFLGSVGSGFKIEFGAKIENPKSVFIGKNVFIGKGTIIVSEIPSAQLRIGNNVQINRSCHIDHTGVLSIGSGTLISESVYIYSHSHGSDPRSSAFPIKKDIGENCWIGTKSMILENASHIPNNTLIGACSVLTKAFQEEGLIIVGLPAKKISKR